MPRLGVLGWPVAHSRSPAMQNAALAAAGLDGWRYQALPVPPAAFAETVRALEPAGFRGANVTIPHKEAALALATEASATARAIGAANTLTFEDGAIRAENTDAPGLIAALPESPRAKSALVLGAGGSARAVVWALREAGAAEIRVWNRTPARAAALAIAFGVRETAVLTRADLLVNCTSAGLRHPSTTFKDLPLRADALSEYACVVDLVYRPGGTELLRAARDAGAAVVDGLEILVRQGALSFELWTGSPAPIEAMREAAHGARRGRHDGGAGAPSPGR
ncbi:MAG TPA: shikimate dehydrogenase [Solirubrobacteraceae bacterium]|nr:shikimate dehydrogenase [Solirubrobacteraceae bacterium]